MLFYRFELLLEFFILPIFIGLYLLGGIELVVALGIEGGDGLVAVGGAGVVLVVELGVVELGVVGGAGSTAWVLSDGVAVAGGDVVDLVVDDAGGVAYIAEGGLVVVVAVGVLVVADAGGGLVVVVAGGVVGCFLVVAAADVAAWLGELVEHEVGY